MEKSIEKGCKNYRYKEKKDLKKYKKAIKITKVIDGKEVE